MKKITTIIFSTLVTLLTIQGAQAQFTSAGAGLMYGTEIEKLGVRIDGTYTINEEFRAVADVGIYLPEDFGNSTLTWWELNANGNYLFFVDEEQGLNAYAIGGLNFTTISWDYDDGNAFLDDASSTEVGLNIGIGGEYSLDFANLFGEIKYVLGDADQLNIGVGLRLPFGN